MSQPITALRLPRRRWFRFSLRTLIVFVTLAAIGMAWVASEQAQRDANFKSRKTSPTSSGRWRSFPDRSTRHAPEHRLRTTSLGGVRHWATFWGQESKPCMQVN